MDINHLDIPNLGKIPVKIENNPFRLLAINIINGCDNFNDAKELFANSYLNQKVRQTLGILYDIPNSNIAHLPADTIFFPWIHQKPVNYKRFNESHFFSIFSNESCLKKHYNRIKKLVYSIKEYGYVPDKFPTRQGGICGHFLAHGDNKKFFVSAGNHRVAVLSALYPDKKIPVIFEEKSFFKPRDLENRGPILDIYSSDNVNNWPSVKNNFLKKEDALKMFGLYL